MSFLQRLLGKRPPREVRDDAWQTPVVQEICIAMLRLVPDDWESAALVLEPTERGLGSGLSHSAITPTPVRDLTIRDGRFVTPDAAVMAATRKLELGWLQRKGTFKRAIITAVQSGDDWDIRSEYEHE